MENNLETVEQATDSTSDTSVEAVDNSGHGTVYGILYILLGLVAIFLPSVTSFGVEMVVGFTLMIQGVFKLFRSIKNRGEGGMVLGILLAIITFFSGLFFVQNPLAGVISITAFIAIYFVANGVLKFINVFKTDKEEGSRIKKSVVAVISIMFGFGVWGSVVMSSTLIIGYMIGVLLIIDGLSYIRGKDVKGIRGRFFTNDPAGTSDEPKD